MPGPYAVRAHEEHTGACTSTIHETERAAREAARQFRNGGYDTVWIEDADGNRIQGASLSSNCRGRSECRFPAAPESKDGDLLIPGR